MYEDALDGPCVYWAGYVSSGTEGYEEVDVGRDPRMCQLFVDSWFGSILDSVTDFVEDAANTIIDIGVNTGLDVTDDFVEFVDGIEDVWDDIENLFDPDDPNVEFYRPPTPPPCADPYWVQHFRRGTVLDGKFLPAATPCPAGASLHCAECPDQTYWVSTPTAKMLQVGRLNDAECEAACFQRAEVCTYWLVSPPAPKLVNNEGNDCWSQCGERGGECPAFCGDPNHAACCRWGQDWTDQAPVCQRVDYHYRWPRTDAHMCVPFAPPAQCHLGVVDQYMPDDCPGESAVTKEVSWQASCEQDAAGSRWHGKVVPDHAPLPDGENIGKECWSECGVGGGGGTCDFCGSDAACCRPGWADDPAVCAHADQVNWPCVDFIHCCVRLGVKTSFGWQNVAAADASCTLAGETPAPKKPRVGIAFGGGGHRALGVTWSVTRGLSLHSDAAGTPLQDAFDFAACNSGGCWGLDLLVMSSQASARHRINMRPCARAPLPCWRNA